MVKGVVLAANYHQFATYIRNRNLVREEYGYFKGDLSPLYGLPTNTKILALEGWSTNPNIKDKHIDFIKHRFEKVTQIPEGFIYGQNFGF